MVNRVSNLFVLLGVTALLSPSSFSDELTIIERVGKLMNYVSDNGSLDADDWVDFLEGPVRECEIQLSQVSAGRSLEGVVDPEAVSYIARVLMGPNAFIDEDLTPVEKIWSDLLVPHNIHLPIPSDLVENTLDSIEKEDLDPKSYVESDHRPSRGIDILTRGFSSIEYREAHDYLAGKREFCPNRASFVLTKYVSTGGGIPFNRDRFQKFFSRYRSVKNSPRYARLLFALLEGANDRILKSGLSDEEMILLVKTIISQIVLPTDEVSTDEFFEVAPLFPQSSHVLLLSKVLEIMKEKGLEIGGVLNQAVDGEKRDRLMELVLQTDSPMTGEKPRSPVDESDISPISLQAADSFIAGLMSDPDEKSRSFARLLLDQADTGTIDDLLEGKGAFSSDPTDQEEDSEYPEFDKSNFSTEEEVVAEKAVYEGHAPSVDALVLLIQNGLNIDVRWQTSLLMNYLFLPTLRETEKKVFRALGSSGSLSGHLREVDSSVLEGAPQKLIDRYEQFKRMAQRWNSGDSSNSGSGQ